MHFYTEYSTTYSIFFFFFMTQRAAWQLPGGHKLVSFPFFWPSARKICLNIKTSSACSFNISAIAYLPASSNYGVGLLKNQGKQI